MDVKSIICSRDSILGSRSIGCPSFRIARVGAIPVRRTAVRGNTGIQKPGLVISQQIESKIKSVSVAGAASTEPRLTSTHSVKLKTPRVAVFSSANYVRNFFEAVLTAACPGSTFFEVQFARSFKFVLKPSDHVRRRRSPCLGRWLIN
jgi:hypothetical protein